MTTPSRPAKRYAHANDAMRRVTSEADAQHVIDRLRGKRVVTVDMDGTVYDPWSCCGHRGTFRADPACTHARTDTFERIEQACRYYDAVPVILSWRAGLVDISVEWARQTGLNPVAVFIPGSDDDIATLRASTDHNANRKTFGGGQVAFKLGTVQALEQVIGADVVASFDDNKDVIAALADHGVPHAHQVEYLVDIAPHEWTAGYLGAPKPNRATGRTGRPSWLPNWAPARTQSSWDTWKPSKPSTSRQLDLGFPRDDNPFEVTDECVSCGESTSLVPSDFIEELCGWCESNSDVIEDYDLEDLIPDAPFHLLDNDPEDDDSEYAEGDIVMFKARNGEVESGLIIAVDSFDEVVIETDDGEPCWVSIHNITARMPF